MPRVYNSYRREVELSGVRIIKIEKFEWFWSCRILGNHSSFFCACELFYWFLSFHKSQVSSAFCSQCKWIPASIRFKFAPRVRRHCRIPHFYVKLTPDCITSTAWNIINRIVIYYITCVSYYCSVICRGFCCLNVIFVVTRYTLSFFHLKQSFCFLYIWSYVHLVIRVEHGQFATWSAFRLGNLRMNLLFVCDLVVFAV